jgi:cob(I)alamin adenosyltransferase
MATKIYTKTGDKGQTGLLGGTRVPKHDLRIQAYGTVDELNSHIGLVRDMITTQRTELIDADAIKQLLIIVQDRLFTIGSHLAADPEKNKMALPPMHDTDVTELENAIDQINDRIPPMKFFVLPGGHITISHLHVARCVCRRAERLVIELNEAQLVLPLILVYLNRLSDYLFTLSRGIAFDLKAEETPWHPRKE